MRKILLIAIFIASSICMAEDNTEVDYFAPLQGVWFGTRDAHRFILVISHDKMLFIHPTAATTSPFRVNSDEIDIDRYDGTEQFGLYRVDAGRLLLTLADPGLEIRPGAVGNDASRQGDKDTAIFTRTATEGALTTMWVIARNSTERFQNSLEGSLAWVTRQ